VIKDWLSRNGIISENQTQFINRLKEVLFNSLKVTNIECFYKEFADNLLQVVNNTEEKNRDVF
jgi:hypothetical protein